MRLVILSYIIVSRRRIQSESANTRAAEEYCYFSYDTHCFSDFVEEQDFYRHRHLHLTSGSKCFSNFVVTYYHISDSELVLGLLLPITNQSFYW